MEPINGMVGIREFIRSVTCNAILAGAFPAPIHILTLYS